MVKVVLRGPLVSIFSGNEFSVKGDNLISILSKIDKRGIIVSDGRIKPGYLILVNGMDFRLLKRGFGRLRYCRYYSHKSRWMSWKYWN